MANDIISRQDAKAQGLKRYFTGNACKHGHVAERTVGERKCVVCLSKAATIRARRWELNNPEKRKQITERWRKANPELWKASNKRSKAARQKIYTERQRADYQKNPEKYLSVWRNRRAKINGSAGRHTAADLAEILKAQSDKCAYCRISLKRKAKHVDHIQPLSCGGSNDRTNIQYLCAPCNLTKGAKDPILFAQELGRLL